MSGEEEKLLIVADAGGTKTEWFVYSKTRRLGKFYVTEGMNPVVSSEASLLTSLQMLRAFVQSDFCNEGPLKIEIYFFGAGCSSPEVIAKLKDLIKKIFPSNSLTLQIYSDLQGAGVALFGTNTGIACILGTGSASGLFKDGEIIKSVPSLGYVLGDEGSGASMGKFLLNRYFKNGINGDLKCRFQSMYNLSLSEALQRVYKEPNPNKFLASFVPFIKENEEIDEISDLIEYSLKLFFENNVVKYRQPYGTRIRFVGGVANIFQQRIKELAKNYGFNADRFLNRPIEQLAEYYVDKIE